MKLSILIPLLSALSVPAMTACARTPEPASPVAVDAAAQPRAQAASPAATPASAALPLVVMHKSPSCGCCAVWADHMKAEGFPVEIRDVNNMEPVKSRVGVPAGKGSCHTAEVAGYFIEGHVPASDVKRLLEEKPVAKGLTVPGMPIGSPGMEVPGGQVEPYTVELVQNDGTTVPFARHGQQ